MRNVNKQSGDSGGLTTGQVLPSCVRALCAPVWLTLLHLPEKERMYKSKGDDHPDKAASIVFVQIQLLQTALNKGPFALSTTAKSIGSMKGVQLM